jgi:hypothetical protein
MSKKKEEYDITHIGYMVRNAGTRFKKLDKPTKAQQKAYDDLKASADELFKNWEAFMATLKGDK